MLLRVPQRVTSLIDRLYIALKGYDSQFYLARQEEIFAGLGLDYRSAQKRVTDIYSSQPQFDEAMSSEHHVIFAALAAQGTVSNILEIGTFNGINAAFMAHLFPSSQITTIDLPNDDSIFTNTYNRQVDSSRIKFIKKRDNLLGQFDNVHFVRKNSLSLTLQTAQVYDLIWVDGAHGYPVLSADITNAIRLLNPGGFLLCDDIFFSLKSSDDMYCSIAGYETLSAFCHAGLVTVDYIYKRVQKPYGLERFRKHIAVVKQVARTEDV